MRSAALASLALLAFVRASQLAADEPATTPEQPSARLLQTLKHALDSDELLQADFVTEERLKSFLEATSAEPFIKDNDAPHIGTIIVLKSPLAPLGYVRVTSLLVPGAKETRSVSLVVDHVSLTADQVIAVFGPPVRWTREADPEGKRIPLPLHFGDPTGAAKSALHWDGTPRKGASFAVAADGSITSIMMMAIGPVGGTPGT
jgi:hypothetical protein